MTPIERVLAKLPDAKRSGSGWSARCPAHDDQRPSLSVSEGDDGRVLLKCHANCSINSICEALAIKVTDLMPNGLSLPPRSEPSQAGSKSRQNSRVEPASYESANAAIADLERVHGKRSTYWTYHDAMENPIGVIVRWDTDEGKVIRPVSRRNGRWVVGGMFEPRPLYNLAKLTTADRIYILEGEKAADAALEIGLTATTSAHGSASAEKTNWSALAGKECIVLPDNDDAGRAYATAVASILATLDPPATVRIVNLPGLPEKGDIFDWIESRREESPEQLRQQIHDLADRSADEFGTDAGELHNSAVSDERRSQATKIIDLVASAGADLFHDNESNCYVSFEVDGHWETYRLASMPARDWLLHLYFSQYGSAPGSQGIQDAMNTLSARARFEGPERPVSVRMALEGEKVYVDLGGSDWRYVEIDADGWRIVDRAPIRFIRPKGLAALPTPVSAGPLSELRRFINVGDDALWSLVAAWLVAATYPVGPFPLLAVHGEQGSAKSTMCRILRRLIDPNKAELRSAPRDCRDLAIAAQNGWIVALENLSNVSGWLSDALCRLATGGGFATRQLFSDGEEAIFDAQRPILMNGIPELATAPDLLDRAITIVLPSIPETERKPEREFWQEFDRHHASILGALYTAVSTAIRNRPSTHLTRIPRMADFALLSVAAESEFGVKPGTFLDAYETNREVASSDALESCVFARAIEELVSEHPWSGKISELLAELSDRAGEKLTRQREWPKAAHVLSGRIRRLAPSFRSAGIKIEIDDSARPKQITIRRMSHACDGSDISSQNNCPTVSYPRQLTTVDDASAPLDASTEPSHENAADAFDAYDASLHNDSAPEPGEDQWDWIK